MLAMTSGDEDDLPATFFDVKEMAPATDPPPQLPAYEPSDYLQLAIAASLHWPSQRRLELDGLGLSFLDHLLHIAFSQNHSIEELLE